MSGFVKMFGLSQALAALWCASSSAAVVIDFEDGTNGVSIGTSYSAQGVEFSNVQWGYTASSLSGMSGNFYITNISGMANEPKLPDQLTALFPGAAATSVSIDAIDYGEDGVRIDAYDALAGGSLVDSSSAVTSGGGQFIDLSVSGAAIRRIEIYQYQHVVTGDGIVFDNLEFTLVPEPSLAAVLAVGALAMRRRR